jgi:hypothetical protein
LIGLNRPTSLKLLTVLKLLQDKIRGRGVLVKQQLKLELKFELRRIGRGRKVEGQGEEKEERKEQKERQGGVEGHPSSAG